jgi:transcription-repair coupling factor (superfamily II helicase)
LTLSEFTTLYSQHPHIQNITKWIGANDKLLKINGLAGSSRALVLASVFNKTSEKMLFVFDDEEEAAYFYHDLVQILGNDDIFFYPSSYKRAIKYGQIDSANEILRTEVLNAFSNEKKIIAISFPEAIAEKVIPQEQLKQKTLTININERLSTDFVVDMLIDYGFERVDFVYEPGQFSLRGGIIDVFSFSHEQPFRIDFFGDEVDSIRTFDIETQLSKEKRTEISIVPKIKNKKGKSISFFDFISKDETILFFKDVVFVKDRIRQTYDDMLVKKNQDENVADLDHYLITNDYFLENINDFRKVEIGTKSYFKSTLSVDFQTAVQPLFHKNFDLVSDSLQRSIADGYSLYILSDSKKQTDRIAAIFTDRGDAIHFQPVLKTLHEGFIDHDLKICCYTDHQIFDRFHKFSLKSDKARVGKVVMALKELNQFQQGDYVVHIDHGVGRFGGLIKTEVNGKKQEVVKLLFKDDDIIFVSIHSLHRISKYKGKEGEAPRINKLGTGAWQNLKDRTKKKVKDIARDLILLYAKRKSERGFAFSPDSYLQQELEASFIYEDTPDQMTSTAAVKKDMENARPMDRLICGDVGFGKTEVAIRAAFKAAIDGKQVAVLVPTTVLALQHFKTFSERLKDFMCSIDYLSRARKPSQAKEILAKLKEGKIDIIIGTHRLIGKDVVFKDLGLLIVDEEQKFGVSVKEKLKELKINVDTLTLTATPIPRTLQFSLMGARDLSVMHTPPPNRYPVQTELHEFNEDIIRDAIVHEMERNGQVFFVNNRIQNIYQIESMIKRLVPDARVAVGHGQMDSDKLEQIIIDFVDYEYDVLIATSIIESGIDIPNVNTIIINKAQNFGLSDLHQLRGRVGRSNRKAYCYLLAPPTSLLTPEARRRLQAIENFTDLGSGFNIAMQDLDIRGAGNMLGAEQSGFIADLGYETYQKILNEAVQELKDEEFSGLYEEEKTDTTGRYVSECQLESDLELMFPHDYIENVSERMNLYRELDNITDEPSLQDFEARLIDRFGEIPPQGTDLMLAVRLRFLAMNLGVEKLTLKNGKLIAYFVSNNDSSYYKSEAFGKILHYMQNHPRNCQLRDQHGKRSMVITHIDSIAKAYGVAKEI